MKLPTLKSAPVQRLTTPNPEVAAAPMRALGDIGEAIGGQVDEYLEDKARKEAETEVMRAETDSRNALLSVHEKLSANAIQVNDKILRDTAYKDSDIIEGADGEFYVPTHKVSGQILQREQERIYAESTANLTTDLSKEEYDRRWSEMQQRSVETGFKQTKKALQTYTLGESLRTYDEAMSLGNYAGAREALWVARQDGGLSETRYQQALSGVNKKEETDPINMHLAQNDKEALEKDLELLKDKDKKMSLSWDEREALTSEVESELSAMRKSERAMEDGAIWHWQRNTKSVIAAMEAGENLSAEEVSQTKQVADELSQRDDISDSLRGTLADFYEAYSNRDLISEFKKQSPANQEAAIQEARSQEMTAKELDLVNRLEKVHQGTVAALQTDSMSYMEENLSMRVEPLNFENLAASLARRQVVYDATIAQFGMASGYLKEQEAAMVSEMLIGMSTDDVLSFAAQVNQGLGVNAPFFWEQLKQNNLGAISVAGQLASQQNVVEARSVLFGSKLRRDKAIVLQNEATDFNGAIRETLGTAYGFNHVENTYRMDAIKDAYTALAWNSGDTEGELNSDLLDQAIEMVTGGIFEINGVKMPAPEKGITEDRMEQWVENLPPEYISDNGGTSTMPSEQVSDELARGSLQLIPATSNSYYVRVTGTDSYLANNNGGYLELPFDDSLLVTNEYRNVRDIRRGQ